MKTKLIYTIFGLSLFVGCAPTFENQVNEQEEEILVQHNQDILNERVEYVNKPLQLDEDGTASVFDPNSNLKYKGTESNTVSSYSNTNTPDHTWYFVAEVAPPVFNGHKLSATHIQLMDGKAYVSYNKQGDIHLGGLEVFDLSNRAYPKLVSQILFDRADVNAITVDYEGSEANRKIWLALSHKASGAVLREVDLIDGLISESVKDVELSGLLESGISASANSVARSGNKLYVTSGKTYGGTITLNVNSLEKMDVQEYPNAKYIAVNGIIDYASTAVTLVTGDEAKLKLRQIGSIWNDREINIGSIKHQNVEAIYRGKSTLHFADLYPGIVYVALGSEGLSAYDIYSKEKLFQSPENMLQRGNTNGVTSDDNYLYIANGADGLSVAELPNYGENIEPFFSWDLNALGASANYMEADGDWIFVAKGGGGLTILRKGDLGEHKTINGYTANGVPVGMEPVDTPVCSELLPNIYSTILPERQDQTILHPEYFENPYQEIEVEKKTKLFVTFIDEGAGYRNTLGYYTYQKGNKPQSVEELDKTVIFPNASAQYSGGDLIQGNTMKLLGEFEPGTVVGFYLISNGWSGSKISNGIYSQYTIPEFNVSNRQQSVLFYDQQCSSLVMSFEDIALPQGDKDFNDAIFMIQAEDSTAIDVTKFIQK